MAPALCPVVAFWRRFLHSSQKHTKATVITFNGDIRILFLLVALSLCSVMFYSAIPFSRRFFVYVCGAYVSVIGV